MTQGEIIAGAIAASATVDTDAITIDPDKLLDLQAGAERLAARSTPSTASSSRSIPSASRRSSAA